MKIEMKAALRCLILFCVVLFAGACDGNYLVWSSDGKLGAAIGARGLRICDADGNISKVLIEKAGMFRFLPQEHQGLYVGYDYVSRWTDLKQVLTAEQEKQIEEESLKLKRKIYTYHGDSRKFAENALRTFNYPLEAALHLHHVAQPDVERMAARKWPAYPAVKVPVFFVKLVQVEAQSVTQLRTIDKGIDEIVELRVSPGAKFIACVKHEKARERNLLEIIPNSAFAKALPVAVNSNSYPDWSADGRSLYFSRGNSAEETDILKNQPVHEGGLFKVDVADAAGKPPATLHPHKLARLIFDNRAPVRVLKDGRVLFVSREIRIPASVNSNPCAAVFMLDGNRAEPVLRRNDDVVYFEPSPEQDLMAVTTSGGVLLVCKLNGADQLELCNGKETRLSGILPQWKSEQELSYGTEQPAPKGAKPNYSISLWSKGGAVKDLSKSWGKEAASEIIVHKDIFQEAMNGVMEEIDRKTSSGK